MALRDADHSNTTTTIDQCMYWRDLVFTKFPDGILPHNNDLLPTNLKG